jgi:hypothetical protein
MIPILSKEDIILLYAQIPVKPQFWWLNASDGNDWTNMTT